MKLYLTAFFYNLATKETRLQKIYLTEADLTRVLMLPMETAYADDSEVVSRIKLTKLKIRLRSTNGKL